MKPNILDFSTSQLRNWFVELGLPAWRGEQVSQWLYRHGCQSFSEMTTLSKALRLQLAEAFQFQRIEAFVKHEGSDGTDKFVFTLSDGLTVEGVTMRFLKKVTFCLSTQVGCAMGCAFCVTGLSGFKRNLSHSELIDQVLIMKNELIAHGEDATHLNLVLMGMGEPLLNFENVSRFLHTACDDHGLGLSTRKVTVSTVGIPKLIEKFGARHPDIQLAVSLNAPTDELRAKLMPIHEQSALQELIAVLEKYPLAPRRRITIEYVLIRDINDGDSEARKLRALLRKIRCKINIIPYNETPFFHWRSPSEERIGSFGKILRQAGFPVTVRRSRGASIHAACGQLGSGPASNTVR